MEKAYPHRYRSPQSPLRASTAEALRSFVQRAEKVARVSPMPVIHGDLSVRYELEPRTINTADFFPEDRSSPGNEFHYLDLVIAPEGTANHAAGWRAGIILDTPQSHMVARGFSVAQRPEGLRLYETRAARPTEIGEMASGNPFPSFEEATEVTRPWLTIGRLSTLTSFITNAAFLEFKQQEQAVIEATKRAGA